VVRGPRRFLKFLVAILVIAVLAILARSLWLPVFGYALIHDDGPAKADIAVVLAGDYSGRRILKAAELIRGGYVPAALVSGPEGFYGQNESDLEVQYAVSRGCPAGWFISFPDSALSTRDEARLILPELRRRGVHSFLLVTSDYHTGRAGRIFRSAAKATGGGLTMREVAAPDAYFHADSWWRNREAQKTVFTEWCKTLATAIGI
jgi:uncharacterized SAM-binding protein YcdF (DUF218 family)